MESYPRQAAATNGFRNGVPRGFRVTSDAVYFLRSSGSRSSALRLHRWDRATGNTELILSGTTDSARSAAELAMRERLRESASGITAFDVRNDRVVANAAGQLTLWDSASGARVIATGAFDARISPDGQWVAWVADGCLLVQGWEDDQPRTVVQPDGARSWATADFIAAEELDRSRGYWWLPDSSGLLVQSTDESKVPEWFRADPANPDAPPAVQRYPHAGAANAQVDLWRFDLDGEGIRLGLPDHEYLACVTGGVIGLFDRAQTTLTVTDLAGEQIGALRGDPWLDLVPGLPRLDTDGRVLAWVDAPRRTLTRADLTVMPEEVHLRSYVGSIGSSLFVLACSTPAESRLARIDGDTFHWLSDADRFTTAIVEAGVIVTNEVGWDDYRAKVTIRDQDYSPLTEVENLAEEPIVKAMPQHLGGQVNEIQTVVLWPSDVPNEPLPVLMNPYGGPHAQRVLASRTAYAGGQWLADQGYCVIVADGRGTPGQSPQWEHSIAGNLRDLALDDQITALESVAQRFPGRLDLTRVGMLGWSYGGYLSALAVLARPDVFHAAVAGAPVTEWRLYDTAYTERYLGNPLDQPQNYDHSSLLPLADQLTRPLLLIHGLADDNVFAAHTLRLSSELLRAGRAHEVLPLSGISHMTPQPEVAENLLRLQVDFFNRQLKG
jgi:dipeptidyl-peptidase-4